MQLFSGLDYLRIDIANCFGLDKQTWDHRLSWFYLNNSKLEELIHQANEPYLMAKAVMAYRSSIKREPTGHNMSLDSTSSGIQIMACLSGCKETATRTNLIYTGKREDAYGYVADKMNILLGASEKVTRSDIKLPLMTHYYCKIEQETLTENQQRAFYSVLETGFTGAEEVKDLLQSCWNNNTLEHSWVMPDGHEVVCKVKEMVNARIEVDELDHTTFTYRFEANQPSKISSSLCANVIHSVDAYVSREMVRRAKLRGFQLAHVHDSFTFSPKYGNIVRELYRNILAEIAESDLLADICSQITGTKVVIDKSSNNLSKYIKESEYAIT